MTDITTNDPQALVGETVFDTQGEEIGEITGVYLDQLTRQPEWAAVDLGGSVTLVPVAGAVFGEDGMTVPFARTKVSDAPYRQSGLAQAVTPDEEAELRHHYDAESAPPRRRRRSQTTAAAAGVASTAVGETHDVASAAVDKSQEVAAVAVERSHQVAGSAARQVGELADTAKEQVAQVGQELSTQARSLVDETKTQLQGQVQDQTQKLVGNLRQRGNEVLALAEGRPEEAGPLGDYVRRAGARLNQVADDVEAKGPQGVLEEVQVFARTRPGTFVLGAAIVGFGVGRLMRGAADGDGGEAQASSGSGQVRFGAATATAGARRPRAAAGTR